MRVRIMLLPAAVMVATAAMALVPTVALAQRGAGGHGGGHEGAGHHGGAPVYQAGPGHEAAVPKPLAPITFGAVPTLPVIPVVPRVVPAVRAAQSPVRSVRNGRRSGVIVPPVFAWYGGSYPYTVPSASAPAGVPRASTDVYPQPQDGTGYPGTYPQAPPASGSLELQLEPAAAQVYVDGYYTGIVSDFERPGGVGMEPGPHRIEIRAQGYETARFDVRLTTDQTVLYREDLRPLNGVAPPPIEHKAPAPTTFYVIADCYAGNVPPTEAKLRPGCDPAQVKTFVVRR